MTSGALDQIATTADASLKPYFSLTITPLFDTLSAVVLAFILGLCLSTMKVRDRKQPLQRNERFLNDHR